MPDFSSKMLLLTARLLFRKNILVQRLEDAMIFLINRIVERERDDDDRQMGMK
jgi:hypothetical protein